MGKDRRKKNIQEWHETYRKRCREAFQELELRDFRYGLNISVDSKAVGPPPDISVVSDDVASLSFGEIGQGVAQLELNDANASTLMSDMIQAHFRDLSTDDKHDMWHGAFSPGILILRINNSEKDAPIRIDLPQIRSAVPSDIIVFVEEGARALIAERVDCAVDRGYMSSALTVVAGKDSEIVYLSTQDLHEGVTHFRRRKAYIGEGGSISWSDRSFGSGFTRSRTESILSGRHARADLDSSVFCTGNQRHDLMQVSRHLAAETTSRMTNRTVLADAAKAVVRGLIRIDAGARRSSAHQRQETLLLSDSAEIATIPNLEIESHDVSCGHGATVSRPDPDKIFYLMSRGLTRTVAKRKMVEGFLLQGLPTDIMADGIKKTVFRKTGSLFKD